MKLLSPASANSKLKKALQLVPEYRVFSMSLSPHDTAFKGISVCPWSTEGCRDACIHWAGHGQRLRVQELRKARTLWFHSNRVDFLDQLFGELHYQRRLAHRAGKTLAVRLNVFSDIPWEKEGIMREFDDVQFWDYTKSLSRARRSIEDRLWPPNYHLTFSASENTQRIVMCQLLDSLANVAVPFRMDKQTPMPQEIRIDDNTYEMVDGDLHDWRWLDPAGVVVGLRAKGVRGRRDHTGFIRDPQLTAQL